MKQENKEKIAQADKVSVLHVDDTEDKLTQVAAEDVAGETGSEVSFEAEHFSEYAVAFTKKVVKAADAVVSPDMNSADIQNVINDVKNSVKIIHFAGDKPWNNTNCHYDIEQLWWDYALKTPFYYSLLEQLQQNLMSDNTLETIVDDLIKENGELKSKVSSLISINEKLMTMVK